MRFFEAEHLFAEGDDIGAEGIQRGSREVVAVVRSVDGCQRIFLRKDMIKPGSSKIFANGLQGAAEDGGDAVEILSAGSRRGPQVEKRLDAGDGSGSRCQAGNKCNGSLMQVLAEAFVIAEKESFVRADRTAKRGSKLIALKGRGGSLVEEIGSVEGIVA